MTSEHKDLTYLTSDGRNMPHIKHLFTNVICCFYALFRHLSYLFINVKLAFLDHFHLEREVMIVNQNIVYDDAMIILKKNNALKS